MKKVMTTMFVVFFCGLLLHAAPSLHKRAGFYVCTANTVGTAPGSPITYYITGAFLANTDSKPLHDAWANYVSKTYNIPMDHAISEASCIIFPEKADAERGRSNFIAQHPVGQYSKGTVSVDWVYPSSQ